MTTPGLGFAQFLDLAKSLGCGGVELRNDLEEPLFSGMEPIEAGDLVRERGLDVLALAEVTRFDAWDDRVAAEAASLADLASRCGARAVSLIPTNDGCTSTDLNLAMRELEPLLKDKGLIGLVEPLGFTTCSLRHKAKAVEVIEVLGVEATFKLVHDTFHHKVSGEDAFFPEHTGIVHVSGVIDSALSAEDMRDPHRVLVDSADKLGNIEQLSTLLADGYDGPVSYEVFAEAVHELEDPRPDLEASMSFIRSSLAPRRSDSANAL